MKDLKMYEAWFVTGSQGLYGPKVLEQVAEHSREIAATLSSAAAGMVVAEDETGSLDIGQGKKP